MDPTARRIWFVGDLDDPWVADIADSLSELDPIHYESQAEAIPEQPFDAAAPAHVLILHRSRLTPADVARLQELHRKLGADLWPRIVLCVSPYVRYAELEACANLVDLILPEATARETLPRELDRLLGRASASRPDVASDAIAVEVVSTNYEVRNLLREACRRAGYHASDSPDLQAPADLTVWDVPILEPRWTEQLERRSRTGPRRGADWIRRSRGSLGRPRSRRLRLPRPPVRDRRPDPRSRPHRQGNGGRRLRPTRSASSCDPGPARAPNAPRPNAGPRAGRERAGTRCGLSRRRRLECNSGPAN